MPPLLQYLVVSLLLLFGDEVSSQQFELLDGVQVRGPLVGSLVVNGYY